MLSGGIDCSVAGFLTIKQGVDLELIHFESTTLTPLESINKVIDLATKLAVYLPNNRIKLHVVPFLKIHESLLNNVDDSYVITIMRRMMYRIAEKYANENNIDRKSTRLNSSHVRISYAVFCLKKKIIIKIS